MTPVRQTTKFPPGSVHILDSQGDSLARWLHFKNYKLNAGDVFELETTICPDWMWHVVDVTADDPDHYFFKRYDRRCLLENGMDLNGARLIDLPNVDYVVNLREVYRAVKEDHKDRCSLETILSGTPRSFLRIVNHLEFEGSSNQLLIATRYQDVSGHPDVVHEKGSTTSEKIKSTFPPIKGAFERTMTDILALQFDRFKAISMNRYASFNNFFKGLSDNPVYAFKRGNGLGISRNTPGQAGFAVPRINIHSAPVETVTGDKICIASNVHASERGIVVPDFPRTDEIRQVGDAEPLKRTKGCRISFLVGDQNPTAARLIRFGVIEGWYNQRVIRSFATQCRKLLHVIPDFNRITGPTKAGI